MEEIQNIIIWWQGALSTRVLPKKRVEKALFIYENRPLARKRAVPGLYAREDYLPRRPRNRAYAKRLLGVLGEPALPVARDL
jgi:hypothetical protein